MYGDTGIFSGGKGKLDVANNATIEVGQDGNGVASELIIGNFDALIVGYAVNSGYDGVQHTTDDFFR